MNLEASKKRRSSSKLGNELGRPSKESIAAKARGREATMARLIEAGVEVFSQYGYDAATTKLVAKRAGINEALISRYFKGKAGLLLAIVEGFIEREKNSGAFGDHPAGETVEREILNFVKARSEHHMK